MKLDFSSLEKAIIQMEEALAYCESDLAKQDAKLVKHLRAAAIQAFEFSYELSYKLIKRYLEMTEGSPATVSEMDFNETIRTAYARGLLRSELAIWREYRKERGTTSHAYNEEKAMSVFEDIPAFLLDAQYLLAQLKQRQERESDQTA
jgi:nucleotidyltransferase substrate binding protein (TIGR01987 family)